MSFKAKVTIMLLSDAIFGSGYSIPGGEDISVKTDRDGYPYLAGKTFKGLLREEIENWLDWEQAENKRQIVSDMFGAEESWNGNRSKKQVFVSPFRISEEYRAKMPDEYFSMRTFTAIEDGIVKHGSLRLASCIKKGVTFDGYVTCNTGNIEDTVLLYNGLKCIKYVGMERTRGFGKVSVEVGEWKEITVNPVSSAQGTGRYIEYTLELLEPVRVTDKTASHDSYLKGKRYIPGTTVRGAVFDALSKDKDYFESNKQTLLRKLRFFDAVPVRSTENAASVIPTPKGFYGDKLGKEFYNLLVEGEVRKNTKRAGMGQFSSIDTVNGTIGSWSSKTSESMHVNIRLQRDDSDEGGMFRTEWLIEDQLMRGIIRLPDGCSDDLSERICSIMNGQLRLGADVHSGNGLCQASITGFSERAPEHEAYGYSINDTIPNTVFMMLLSPLALVDEYGEPRGIAEVGKDGKPEYKLLSELLGVNVSEVMCSTSISRLNGFNRQLGSRLPVQTVYDIGCVFRLTCDVPPSAERLASLEDNGIGSRREEGFGRVLFIKDFASVAAKEESDFDQSMKLSDIAQKDLRITEWLINSKIPSDLSPSQLGDLESDLVRFAAKPETAASELEEWFTHVFERKDPRVLKKYQEMKEYIDGVLSSDEFPADGIGEKLELIAEHIRFDRRRK